MKALCDMPGISEVCIVISHQMKQKCKTKSRLCKCTQVIRLVPALSMVRSDSLAEDALSHYDFSETSDFISHV